MKSVLSIIFLSITVLFTILHQNILAQESLPPLPDPYDVRLKWTLPREQPYLKDTARISLQGGFYWSDNLSQPGYQMSAQASIPLSFRNKFFLLSGIYSSDIDYDKYRFYSGRIISIVPIRVSLLSNELSINRKSRVSTYCENIIASGSIISPIFLGELNPRFLVRYAQFYRHNHNDFFYFKVSNDYIIPTSIGSFDLAPTLFLQSHVSTKWLIGLSDNIILSDFIFLKPKIDWQPLDQTLSFGSDFGARIGEALNILNIIFNQPQYTNFDSLYADAGPFQINKSLLYPKNNWSTKASIRFRKHTLDLSLQSIDYRINYRQVDSLFYPENSLKRSLAIIFNLNNKFWLAENLFRLKFNTGQLSLVPDFLLFEQIIINRKPFSLALTAEVIGNRKCDNLTLGSKARFNTTVSYHHSFFDVKFEVNNILETSWEFYSNYVDNNRKLLLEITVLKTR
jgi:hypothetical protein